jgi:CheY-like chemotaxis protein
LIELRSRAEGIPTVMIDPKRVRQILFCLTDNAAKYTRKGYAEVRAAFERNEDGKTGTLRFEVEDTGIGISEEDLKRIDTPYAQVESKHSRHGGTGIGLALCRKLADAMGGELAISSVLGKGSTFAVTLHDVQITDAAPVEDHDPLIELLIAARPEAPASAPKPKQAEPKPETPVEAAAAKRILIADDQKVNLMVLKTMLNKLGSFDIAMAKDGKEALDILKSAEAPFDLVLTDMWMPVMDGAGLVSAVRADAKLAKLPVHVVTADMEMPKKYAELGFDGIVVKPVTVEKLKAVLG